MFRKKSKKQKWSGGDGSEGWVVRTLRAFTYGQYTPISIKVASAKNDS